MKPSKRILEIVRKEQKMEGFEANSLIDAIIQYLDEEWNEKEIK